MLTDHIRYLLLGLGGGAAIALLALGLVVTYQASGVVNFAHAAVGTYCAFAFYRFRATGDLVLPIFGVPTLTIGGVPTAATALLMVLAIAAAIGLFLGSVVYRALRTASPLARMVASLGVMLYFIEVCALRFGPTGSTVFAVTSILPDRLRRVTDSIAVYEDRLWLTGVAIVASVVMAGIARYTRFGLATRAVAENQRGALLIGIRTEWVAAGNWVIATVLAALAVILAAPIVKLSATETSLLVVPAIAAALVARFSGLLTAVGAALLIGMAQSDIINLRSTYRWLPQVDLQEGVPVVVILAVLALRAGSLPARGTLGSVRLPSPHIPRRSAAIVMVAGIVGAIGIWFGPSRWRLAIIITAIGAITALSIVVATGYIGQINLATTAFSGVSAFALVKLGSQWGLGFPWAPLLAALIAGLIGVLVGLPASRMRGLTLAMATLAASLAIEKLLFKWTWFGGVEGQVVRPARLPGIDLGITALGTNYPRRMFGLMVIVVSVVLLLTATRFGRSATVRRWLAVRDNERAAAALGIAVAREKVTSLGLSAFIAGIAGALTAYQQQQISPTSFGTLGAVVAVAIVYLAGIASPLGALLAGAMVSGGVLTAALGGASSYQFAINGVVLVAAAMLLPDGIVGRLSRPHRFGRVDRLAPPHRPVSGGRPPAGTVVTHE